MDEERFQQMEKRLNKQAEATRAMNETLNKFLAVMANQEATQNVAPLSLTATCNHTSEGVAPLQS
jgi:peptidoglycan hydrolase CwlO-like protein